jgi:hypothetical protein
MANTTVPAELINTATPLGRRNILINGDFGIYQRAQQVTDLGASENYFTADRCVLNGNLTSGRVTMTAGTEDAPAESNVTTSLKLNCTTADTSLGAGEALTIQQRIEGQNLQHVKKGTSGAKQLTASFWVKGNASATYVLELYDADNTRQVSKSFSVTSSWSKVELTYPADTTGAFGNDANLSLYFQIFLASGTNLTSGTLNQTWNSITNANRAVGISNFLSSTSNEFYITAVQLEVGDVATEFEILSYPERLALCQRYYQKFGPYGTNTFPLGPVSYCYTATNHAIGHTLTTPLRAVPDVEVTGTLQMMGGRNDGQNLGYDITNIFTIAIGNNSVMWNVVANTGAAPGSSPVVGGGSSTTFFAYDSEL